MKNTLLSVTTRTIAIAIIVTGLMVSAFANIKVGQTFPDLAGFKLEGKMPDGLKGKVVLVDFWASWCGPCGESFPVMEELQKKYRPQGLVILAINEDEKKADMEDFLKTHKVSFTVLRDAAQKLVEAAGIESMPGSFLLGPDGRVMFAHKGFHGNETHKQYEQEIQTLLKHSSQ